MATGIKVAGPVGKMKRETPIIGQKGGISIILCHRKRYQYVFYCQYCRHDHYHGIGDGHRVAHCAGETLFKDRGYYLVGNSDMGVAIASSGCILRWPASKQGCQG